MFSRNVRNVCPLRHLPTLTKLRTLPTLRAGGNQESAALRDLDEAWQDDTVQ